MEDGDVGASLEVHTIVARLQTLSSKPLPGCASTSITTRLERDPCLRARAIVGMLHFYNPVDDLQNQSRAMLASNGVAMAQSCGDPSLESYLLAVEAETVYVWLAKRASKLLLAREFAQESKIPSAVPFLTEALQGLETKMQTVSGLFVAALSKAYEARDGIMLGTIGLKIVEAQVNLYAFLLPFVSREELEPLARVAE